MNLRTYRASSIGEALAAVKKDLGREAVILHTRQVRVGGILGFGARAVVEVTASNQVEAPSRLRVRDGGRPMARGAASAEAVRRAYAPVRAEAQEAETDGESLVGAGAAVALGEAGDAAQPAGAGLSPALEEELSAIRRMVGRVLASSGGVARRELPEALMKRYLRLLESEVAGEIADEVATEVAGTLTSEELEDEGAVHDAVLARLARYIPAADDRECPERGADGRPFTLALIGPTGVGKTTTIAKLAATYKLRHGRRVGLITADTYRIAAVDQLRTYANIIGLPLRVANTPGEMAESCDALSDCDVVLIDTAGRSQRDDARLTELRSYLDAARPHQTHLVLSSAACEKALVDIAERFAAVRPNRVIFTKLDEAVSFGVLVNVAKRIDARLSFITTGQEVPDKIEAGGSDRIARLVLEGALGGGA